MTEDESRIAALWDRAVVPVVLDLIDTARIAGIEIPGGITFSASYANGCVYLTLIDTDPARTAA